MDDDYFIKITFPYLTQAWEKQKSMMFNNVLVSLLELLKASNDVNIAFLVPFAALLLADENSSKELQYKLCKLIEDSIDSLRKDRNLAPYTGKRAQDHVRENNTVITQLLSPSQKKKRRVKNRLEPKNLYQNELY